MSLEGPYVFIGDICIRHLKDLHGFEQYEQYYIKQEEARSIFEHEMSKGCQGLRLSLMLRCSDDILIPLQRIKYSFSGLGSGLLQSKSSVLA